MKEKLQSIKTQALKDLKSITDPARLEEMRIKYLGKKGELTSILRQMGGVSEEMRPILGKLANEIRFEIEQQLDVRKEKLSDFLINQRLKNEKIDVTLPPKIKQIGKKHPLSQVLDEISHIFLGLGFCIAEGPEIELDYYNFEALNIPKDHPARDTQDTFYISENVLLRTQTSPVQIRVMEKTKPPIKIIAPGRVYRSDAVDATHSPVFHQIEGLLVDKGVTMADLKGALEVFAKGLYGDGAKIRFRPHHFQFTEPSAEVDIMCFACGGKGCGLCKGEGWIEILGGGMVHPKVLKICGIDPQIYSGFAFGIGLERIAMRKYNINDLRLFFENDLRFLNQF